MTIIIGVKCDDGIVIGADTTATLGGGLFQNTVEQHQQPKIEIIPNYPVIAAYSGFVGLGQRILLSLQKEWEEILGCNKLDARAKIRDSILKQIMTPLRVADLARQVYGDAARGTAICHTLFAFPIEGETLLVEFDPLGADEEKTSSIPFVSIGSGGKEADFFLSFIKEFLWDDKHPSNLADAKRAIIWTIALIKKYHSGGGIGGDTQVASLIKIENGTFVAEMDNRLSIDMHEENIEGCKSLLQDYFLNKPESNQNG